MKLGEHQRSLLAAGCLTPMILLLSRRGRLSEFLCRRRGKIAVLDFVDAPPEVIDSAPDVAIAKWEVNHRPPRFKCCGNRLPVTAANGVTEVGR